ncbi:MAG: hypothetical protein AAF191_05375, partial [Verrucomicrobiota bacterium]
MGALFDPNDLDRKVGTYYTGKAALLADPTLLQLVRMKRRQIGQQFVGLDRETAQRKLPSRADFFISRKIDGEFTCLLFLEGEVFTLNPGGTLRLGAPFHEEAKELLEAAELSSAVIGGELYVRRPDGKRPRVHDVTRVARAPKTEEEVGQLGFAVFDLYQLNGEEVSLPTDELVGQIETIFGNGERVHPVEMVPGKGCKEVLDQFSAWVEEEGGEGVVVRSDQAGCFKVKSRHTLDLAVVGFAEGIEDRAGLLHDLLLAVVRTDGTFHLVCRVGGGFSEEERMNLLPFLEKRLADSDYTEVNSDRVAYRMIRPGLVIEISCLELIAETSRGGTIDRMVLEWSEERDCWEGLRRLPLCSVISPQFLRIREDKETTAEDVRMSQLSELVEIPELHTSAEDLKLPTSEILRRTVATKEQKGSLMVRKIMLWKTHKEEVSEDYPAYVLHLTDF